MIGQNPSPDELGVEILLAVPVGPKVDLVHKSLTTTYHNAKSAPDRASKRSSPVQARRQSDIQSRPLDPPTVLALTGEYERSTVSVYHRGSTLKYVKPAIGMSPFL
jgi:hypothetical protein